MAEETTNPNGDQAPTPEPTTAPPAAQPPAEPAKTFTQADIDKIVRERLQRQKEQFADYDQYKAAADELAKIKESQLSETEKLTKRLAELEQAKTQAEATAKETLIRSAVVSEAAKLRFNDPEDAYRLADLSAVAIGESGKVEGALEAVKALAESRKYLIQNNNPALSTFNPAGAGGQAQETDAQKRARIYGGGGNYFDAGRAAEQGGGVIIPKGVWPE